MKRIVLSEFIERSNQIHGEKYDYTRVEFKNNDSIVEIICPEHGIFNQKLSSHLSGYGCKKCNYDRRRKTIVNFVDSSNLIHNNKYDYSLVEYTTINKNVKIKCSQHGIFEKSPKNHLKGQGCPSCIKINTDKFIEMCEIKHGSKYDYSLSIYKGAHKKLDIICPIHGIFEQTAAQHMKGHGCSMCGKNLGINKFIERSQLVHKNKYDYSESIYKNSKSKVNIICPKHGNFSQIASDHMRGFGCPSCGSEISISKLENKWLDEIGISIENRQFKISKYIVDGYDPNTKTIYEFNGDFWHGNPNKYDQSDINPQTKCTFGHLYRKTLNKERSLMKNGYKVISIWESDYKKINQL